jgi:hypothetical protein
MVPALVIFAVLWGCKAAPDVKQQLVLLERATAKVAASMEVRFPIKYGVGAGVDLSGHWAGRPANYEFELRGEGDVYKGTHTFRTCTTEAVDGITAHREGDRVIATCAKAFEIELRVAQFEGEVVLIYQLLDDKLRAGTFIHPRIVKDWKNHPMVLRRLP